MGKEYLKTDMERILKQDVRIPDTVEKRIEETYMQIGAGKTVSMRYHKHRKVWKVIAAVAVLTIGTSAVVVAANKLLSARLTEDVENNEKVTYDIQVDREIEAHAIEVKPTYMPEGYVYQEDGPRVGKWYNAETGDGLTIITYNAAELDRIARLGDDQAFFTYKKDEHLKELNIDEQKMDVFVSDGFYVDTEDTVKNLYLFDEEYGYGIRIWNESTMGAEEIIKIAEGLEVTVLDEVVPYATEAEIEEELSARKKMEQDAQRFSTVPADAVFEIGEEIANPFYAEAKAQGVADENMDDIRYTVKSVEVRDSVSLDEFPAENFMTYEDISPWLNEDGTLKPYERCQQTADGEMTESETVNSKYVVVEMNIRNAVETRSDVSVVNDVMFTPMLTTLTPLEDGNYARRSEFYLPSNEGYHLQYGGDDGGNFAIYFDQPYYTEGIERLKRSHIRPLAAGESMDYTLIYVVDEDQIDNMCLGFFSGGGAAGSNASQPYVAVGKNVQK